jgi:hypothetical protein
MVRRERTARMTRSGSLNAMQATRTGMETNPSSFTLMTKSWLLAHCTMRSSTTSSTSRLRNPLMPVTCSGILRVCSHRPPRLRRQVGALRRARTRTRSCHAQVEAKRRARVKRGGGVLSEVGRFRLQ